MRDVEKEIYIVLENKLDKFREYQKVTEKMKKTVSGNDKSDELSRLINRRQKCIGAIEKINSSMENIIQNGSIKFSCISKKYKGLVESCLTSIKEVMMQVDLMDRELVTIVTEQGESIKREILKTRNIQRATRGYQAHRRYPAKFLDTRK